MMNCLETDVKHQLSLTNRQITDLHILLFDRGLKAINEQAKTGVSTAG